MNRSTPPVVSGEMREQILKLEGIPPFPATASQILSECQKPDVEVRTVTQLVECEPAVSAKVLQLANSPLYGASRPIVSIHHAIVVLGFKSVSQMAIAIAAGALFRSGDPQLAEYRRVVFRQSIACAITSRMLAMEMGTVSPDEAFLCGVMHDVGKLVLFDVAPEQYCGLLDNSESNDTTSIEQALFGIDHAGLGKKCGTKWGFPSPINLAIEHHHRKIGETTHALSQAVVAGNYFSSRWSITDDSMAIQPENLNIEKEFNASKLESIKNECGEQFDVVIKICSGGQ